MESEEQQQQQQQQTEPPAPQSQGTFDINRVIEQAREVLTNPAGFYRDMPGSGGFTEPVIFVAVMAVATGIIAAVWSLFTSGHGFLAAGFAGIIIYPIFAVIGAFIAAAILFVIWKLMGSERDYETAFRCWSAATAVYPVGALLSIIPYIGVMVSVAWGTLLMIEASVAVHQRERRTAMIVFGILGGLLLISNISSEYASRQMADRMSEMSRQFEGFEDMSSEEAGRQIGEFLKGLEEGAKKDGDEG
ncbi:YIP1 family protein [Parahaliea mediterranea]|uniref:YIP1 family protein n=1 Tax=Parahaliea mediterranea TaxID=651086 RepID=A0A939DDJ9_9GAMM|nr:YIP1 family protein [Parahaliea mediterranea]MBN7796213.1 YIP1 family protein [Parahaliea mediterranea]